MLNNISNNDTTIGEIVANDFRAAAIFKNAGLDFCCGGKNSLKEICSEKAIDPATIIDLLKNLEKTPVNSSQNYNDWELGFLIDYIINTHHKFVLKKLPDLVFYTQKIANVHGLHHPELIEVSDLFDKINTELLQHLRNEEEVLFPAIKEALKSNSSEARQTIKSEILRMSDEHEYAGGAMDKINVITSNYKVPADGCNTYNVAFKLLEEFEDDLHIHVHLENNILYSKALSL